MDDVKALESNLCAPAAEVGGRVIKGVAEFDPHVDGHQYAEEVLAAGIVDDGFNRYQRAAGRQIERRKGKVRPLPCGADCRRHLCRKGVEETETLMRERQVIPPIEFLEHSLAAMLDTLCGLPVRRASVSSCRNVKRRSFSMLSMQVL